MGATTHNPRKFEVDGPENGMAVPEGLIMPSRVFFSRTNYSYWNQIVVEQYLRTTSYVYTNGINYSTCICVIHGIILTCTTIIIIIIVIIVIIVIIIAIRPLLMQSDLQSVGNGAIGTFTRAFAPKMCEVAVSRLRMTWTYLQDLSRAVSRFSRCPVARNHLR